MAHIHLQDGTLPFAWAAFWWALALLLLAVCLVRLRRRPLEPGPVTLAAFCTATVFALSQVEIPILGGVHLSLMPLSGILLGPLLGSVVALVANIFSAAVGHGGWSVIGANILVNATEIGTAWAVFRATAGRQGSVFMRGAGATFLALLAGTLVMIGIVSVSGIQGVTEGAGAVASGLVVIGAINLGVGAVEAIVTGYLLAYLARVRPDILGERPIARLE
ncbi:MAG TPA: energy-coupling factor ABC transporter permease [Methanoregulaceae archaeon]|nr:energy-coupling factor ABC transporter permease [Methanoregulaceae archaeon]